MRRAFTLIELLATLAIVAVLTVSAMVFIGNYLATARTTSDKQTLLVLNDALTRYKTEGGNPAALTVGSNIGNLLQKLSQTVSWAGLTHQFLRTGQTYPAHSLDAQGTGRNFRFVHYGSYTDSSVDTDGETSTYTANTSFPTGNITRELYLNAGLNSTTHQPVTTVPVSLSTMTSLQSPISVGENYSQRVRGYLFAPTTGSYTFTLSADDKAYLFLSTDYTAGNATVVISAAYGSATYTTTLNANTPYYFCITHNEGSGGDYFRLGWTGPSGLNQTAITGEYFADAYSATGTTIATFKSTPARTCVATGSSTSFSASITGGTNYQWYRNGLKISGATTSTLTLSSLTLSNNGDKYYATATAGGQTYTSEASTLFVSTPLANTGSITGEYYDSITVGNATSELTSDARYIAHTPTGTTTATSFSIPSGAYRGWSVQGYLCPPYTGSYQISFTMYNVADFYLSTDSNPANIVLKRSNGSNNFAVNLTAGQKYYFKILQVTKSNTGNLLVEWNYNNIAESPIKGSWLAPYP